MKISKIIFAIAIASTFIVSSCRDTKTEATDDHGHEHDADGGHMD
jgi:zinc transport system substrate-binding protein